MTLQRPVPRGECRQCWRHAYDPSIHRRLKPREDCKACVDRLVNGHGDQIQQ